MSDSNLIALAPAEVYVVFAVALVGGWMAGCCLSVMHRALRAAIGRGVRRAAHWLSSRGVATEA